MSSLSDKPSLNELRETIADTLAQEKAYNLPALCETFGLAPGETSEAFSSKRVYVRQRLVGKSEDFLINIAHKTLVEYPSEELRKILGKFSSDEYEVTVVTRKNILDELIVTEEIRDLRIHGRLDLVDFLRRVWPLDEMPSTDYRFDTAAGDISQHMVMNNDWDYHYLFNGYLGLTHSPDDIFLRFLEEVTHPIVQKPNEQSQLVILINNHLIADGFRLDVRESISGIPVYRAIKLGSGVAGNVKNLIFAADGPKPEIILEDSINNDIRIVKNQEHCLVYDLPIPHTGLLWADLVVWWTQQVNHSTPTIETERLLYKRLLKSLASPPEVLLFDAYFRHFRDEFGESLPALIPQVYLHYDPYTLKELKGKKRVPRQRMDFLILFSNHERVVIEVDGKQHYADGNNANPKLYADMVAADRKLRLAGYEIYRFGAYELIDKTGKILVENFFRELFRKHKSLG